MKKYLPIFAIVLVGWLALILSGCDNEMRSTMDPIVDAVIDDTPPPKPVTPREPEPTPEPTVIPPTPEPTPEPPVTAPAPVAPLPAGTVVFVEPRQIPSPAVGQQLIVNINVQEAADVLAYEMTVGFDLTALRYVGIENADYLPAGAFAAPPQAGRNRVYFAATSVAGTAGAASGTLATVTFEVVSAKASTITLTDVLLSDSNVTPLALQTVDGKITAP